MEDTETSCPKCDGFNERLNLELSREYKDLAQELQEIVAEGAFDLVQGDPPLEKVVLGEWDGYDLIEHRFRCISCGRLFELSADVYHGGARWRPL